MFEILVFFGKGQSPSNGTYFFIRSKGNLFDHRNETECEVDLAVSVGMVDIDLDEDAVSVTGTCGTQGEMMLCLWRFIYKTHTSNHMCLHY